MATYFTAPAHERLNVFFGEFSAGVEIARKYGWRFVNCANGILSPVEELLLRGKI